MLSQPTKSISQSTNGSKPICEKYWPLVTENYGKVSSFTLQLVSYAISWPILTVTYSGKCLSFIGNNEQNVCILHVITYSMYIKNKF